MSRYSRPIFSAISGIILSLFLLSGGVCPSVWAAPLEVDIREARGTLTRLIEIYRARVVDPQKTAPALPRIPDSIRVDGRLDEPAWDHAMVWELKYEIELGNNDPAQETTLVLMGLTDDAVVFAFLCHDAKISHLRTSLADRENFSNDDDMVGLIVDTFGDQRHAYQVLVNAYGVQADFLRSEENEDPTFDFLWYSATRLYPDGYIAEIALPFRYLQYRTGDAAATTWRLAPFRLFPREHRYTFSPIKFDFNRNCFLCQLPEVRVTVPHQSSHALQFIPYTRGIAEGATDTASAFDPGAGVDVKYRPTANWTLDATLLPDFSQVETDVFQITTNLRFLPFYPERRPFFMERTDLFETPLPIIYTRTILDPYYGARATGKIGRHTLAVLHALDRNTWLLFPGPLTSNSTVLDRDSLNTILRYRFDLGQRSLLGLLWTDRTYRDGFNRVLSFDGRWTLGRQFILQAQALGSWTRYPKRIAHDFDQSQGTLFGYATWFHFSRTGKNWNFFIEWDDRDRDLRTDMGFIQQVGTRSVTMEQSLALWPHAPWLKNIGFFTEGTYRWKQPYKPLEWNVVTGAFINLLGQTSVNLGYQVGDETVAGRRFRTRYWFSNLRSDPVEWFAGSLRLTWGRAIDYTLEEPADMLRISFRHRWKILRRIVMQHQITYRRLYQEATLQDTWLQTLRLEWQFTPKFGMRHIIQWQQNRFSDVRYQERDFPDKFTLAQVQSLLRYRVNYATVLFVGFFGERARFGAETQTRWSAFLKFSYLFNL